MSVPTVADHPNVEAYLAALWRRILQREPIEPEVSFFDLGGGSIHVVQMLAEVCCHYDIDLDYGQFFEQPTLAVLARLVDEKIAP